MSTRTNDETPRNPQDRKSPDPDYYPQKNYNNNFKNPYIGLTLMEYFKIGNSKPGLEEIDEESNSSISAGTPCFIDFKDQVAIHPQTKKHRRDKARTESEEDLLPALKYPSDAPLPKISTINLEDVALFDKNLIKLPSIYDHRHTNNSRQGMIKDGKIFQQKKDSSYKSKNQQNHTNSLNKHNQINRIHQIQKSNNLGRKSIRARVTSTSFYHANLKERQRERQRVKTEEEITQKNLEKSFIVTKYGMNFPKKSKEQYHYNQQVKKQENTFKLLKNTSN